MPADIDDLLAEASTDPSAPDADAIWAAGRRRRRLLQTGAVASAAAGVALVGVVAVGLDLTPSPTIDPVAQDEAADPAEDETDTGGDLAGEGGTSDATPPGDELPRLEMPPAPPPDDPEPEAEPEAEAEATEQPEEPAPQGPEPDPAAVASPCAGHEGREGEAFIDVVSPVGGQQVAGGFELVGCSNVPEANVRYRVVDGSGGVVVDDFTTATCGTGCVGEFREQVSLPASGDLRLQVFWDSPADGSEQDLTEVPVTGG